MALTVYLKSDATTYTLTDEVAYKVYAESLPSLVWELEGETLNELSAGDITLTCENVTGWWTTWAASLDHTARYPTAWYIEIFKGLTLRWSGDIDVTSVTFDTQHYLCSFTVRGKLSRLERYNAEDVKRALPTHFDFGYGTAAAAVVADLTKDWTADSLINHVLIDNTSTCFTISDNDATTVAVSAGAPATGYYRIRPYAFKLSVAGHNHTFADADVEAHAADTITVTTHGMTTGEPVEYYTSAGNVVTGLTDHTVYWVIKHDNDNIQLATTKALADIGTAITGLAAPAGGDTHYLVHNTDANALRMADGGPTSTVALLDTGDTIRITRTGAVPYRSVASKPGITYARTIYPQWAFDFEDVEILFAGPRVNTLAPQVTLDADQVLIDQAFQEMLTVNDGYVITTPYHRNEKVVELVRKLFVSCSLTENDDFVIAIPDFYANQVIPYADFSGKSVAEALVELGALSGCMLYSTGYKWIFGPRDLERPGATTKTIASTSVCEDTLSPMWEHSYDFVSVKDGEGREVRRGRYLTTGNGLEIETDYSLNYSHLRAIANRGIEIFGGRRKYREIVVNVDGNEEVTVDHGLFMSATGYPISWTQYNIGGQDASMPWTVDGSYHCNLTPDDGDKWYMLCNDDIGPARHADIYCDIMLPNFAGSYACMVCCVPDSLMATGWALKLGGAAAHMFAIGEFTSSGALTERIADATAAPAADTWYRCRLQVRGYNIKAKYWLKTADEPTAWTLEYTAATKSTTGYTGLAVYEDDASDPVYEFDNFFVNGCGDYELGYNIGDKISYDSEEWWVIGIDEPIRAYTYGDKVTLRMVSARSYYADEWDARTWAKLGYSTTPTSYIQLGACAAADETLISAASDWIASGGHGFTTGMPIGYVLDGGNTVGGLTDGTIYYAIKHDDDKFHLATTLANALLAADAGAIDLSAPGGPGTGNYTFSRVVGNFAGSFTICFWMGADASCWTAGDIVLARGAEGGTDGWAIELRGTLFGSNKLRAYLRGLTFTGGLNYVETDVLGAAGVGAAMHVALVVDITAAQARFWINGAASAAAASITGGTAVTATARPLTIGDWSDLPADHHYGGLIRDLSLWDCKLYQTETERQAGLDATPPDIAETFPSSVQRLMYVQPRGDEPYLSAYYKLNEGYGARVLDSTPFQQDGVGFDNAWQLPANCALATAAKPEPPTILYYAVSATDEVVVDANLPTDRMFGWYVRIWASTGNSTNPDYEFFVAQDDYQPYYHGWPISGTVIVQSRYILYLPSTYNGYNIDVAVVSFDGHMSDPSEPYICRDSHPIAV